MTQLFLPVACSTVTVTKCQAALRTLQAFPFFKPTCLCREPNVDPECNSFRDFLFDHPCVFVMKKGEFCNLPLGSQTWIPIAIPFSDHPCVFVMSF